VEEKDSRSFSDGIVKSTKVLLNSRTSG
jgi:hypothetical protein